MFQDKKLKILAAGDIHGSEEIAEHLAIKAEKNKVDLIILAGDISNPSKKEKVWGHFKERGLETLFVPGNWDFDPDIDFMKNKYGAINLDNKPIERSGIDFIGFGSSNFKLNHDKNDFSRFQNSFEKIKNKPTKKVIISHLHAAGTKAEFSGFTGSYILRKIIDNYKPHLLISSHIHEAEGMEETINETKIIQVGFFGKILEI